MNQLLPSATTDNKGGNAMKNYLAFFACLALLLTLAGCQTDPNGIASKMGFSTPDNDAAINSETLVGSYDTALSAIERGDLTAAYEQLTHCDDPRAAELLEKLVFVPVSTSLSISNGNKFSTEYTYDANGNLLQRIHCDKGEKTEVLFTYDDEGKMLTETYRYDHGDIKITYTYNERGLLSRRHRIDYDGSESVRAFTYDGQGRPTTERLDTNYDGSDQSVTYVYSADGLSVTKSVVFDTGERIEETLACDADGNPVYDTEQETDEVEYTYDDLGRIATEESNGNTTVYTYDGEGKNPVSATITGRNRTVQITYDENGLWVKKVTVYGDGEPVTTLRTYDEYGNLIEEQMTNPEGKSYTAAKAWALQYFTNGVPENVAALIEGANAEVELEN